MAKIDEFVEAVQDHDRGGFVTHYPHPFLLLFLEAEESRGEWSFKTTTISSKKINMARMLDENGLALTKDSDRYRIFGVVKSAGNPWQERISIGRARNNDIVLPHKSVSKLHAHFVQDPKGLHLADAGSRNGTRINDRKISSGKLEKPVPGDEITFGGITLKLVEPGELYDLVQKHLKPRGDAG